MGGWRGEGACLASSHGAGGVGALFWLVRCWLGGLGWVEGGEGGSEEGDKEGGVIRGVGWMAGWLAREMGH